MNFETLRNKFEKLREDWAEDSAVDFQFKNKQYSTDLGQLALDIPFQHNKYLNHYTDIQQIKNLAGVWDPQSGKREAWVLLWRGRR